LAASQETCIGGSVWRQLRGTDPNCPTHRALVEVHNRAAQAPGEHAVALRRLVTLLQRKGDLVGRARRDVQIKALLDIWLYIHVPLSFALVAALVAHIVAVFFYW
jgi:ABC-type transport system involved in cytochrome bd biosynthesis fused ATPase/permease subunit